MKARAATLQPGDRVLVKIVAFDGKHKISDRWETNAYIVESQPNPDIPVYTVRPEGGEGSKRTLHRNLLLPIGALPFHSEHHERKKEKQAFKSATPKTRNSPTNNNCKETDSDQDENNHISLYFPSDTEMIGISGGSDMADTEDMSVRTRVDDDLAGGNFITDSSSEGLAVDDNSSSHDEGNPSVGEEFVSATSVDDDNQSGHIAEQSGSMSPEHTVTSIDNSSEVSRHTKVESPSNITTDRLKTENSSLPVPAPRSSSRVPKTPTWMTSGDYVMSQAVNEPDWLTKVRILQSLHMNGDFKNMPDTVSNAIISIMVDTPK
ncbi:hypothetical protein ACJMK2_019662 [Sinanodonta woodiana]|uniref:Uncharacterized protein n=1 Tax=Sinanodonta woodiana TaxID=1069815 RepID=A0ABD3TWX8_SINWO